MKDEATPEQIELARRIAEQCNPGLHRVSGDLEAVALAAIIETQRLDAELVEWMGDDHPRFAERAATAIRAGKHYGKDER